MQFKIKNTLYEISFSFFALILLLLTFSKDKSNLMVFLFAFLHELVHLFFIYKYSLAPKKVSFSLFGANIIREVRVHNNIKQELLINLSAPLFNLFSGIIFYFLNIFKGNSIILNLSLINTVLGLFNLIPFYNFDGGNALKCILSDRISEKTTEIIMLFISIIITLFFSFASVYIFFNFQHNVTLIFVSFYMIFSIVFKK